MIPTHVAIIPDGNRRWAKEHNLPTFEGHRKGFEIARKLIQKSKKLGIKIFTLWAFSTENWKRKNSEVSFLMGLFETMIDDNLKEALKDNSRIIHIGRKDRISEKLRKKIINAEEKTKEFSKRYLVIALDYGGRDEIVRAFEKIRNPIHSASSGQEFEIRNLNTKTFDKFLDTKDLPQQNPDLIIRTSGEQRTSGFMLWQSEYTEYMFVNKYFPDFTPEEFESCIRTYSSRIRRFGE